MDKSEKIAQKINSQLKVGSVWELTTSGLWTHRANTYKCMLIGSTKIKEANCFGEFQVESYWKHTLASRDYVFVRVSIDNPSHPANWKELEFFNIKGSDFKRFFNDLKNKKGDAKEINCLDGWFRFKAKKV